jgi:tetratricopeptide (TPR) repeat protein
MAQISMAQAPARQAAAWPALSGLMPPLVDPYVPRQETGLGLAVTLLPGESTVLAPAADAAGQPLGPLGGTGKTQLAAGIAHTAWDQRVVDLLVWATASGRDAVIGSYAHALQDIGLPPAERPERAAAHFLSWLAETDRPWLVVLDDLTDPEVLEGLWPQGPAGRVLITTSQADTALRAHNPRIVEVGAFTAREALAYFSTKLHADPDQWIGALDLAGDLGFLPLAVGQAGALMADTGMDCRQYRQRVAERLAAGPEPGSYRSVVAATASLAVALADQLPPIGLATPALALTAMLDPNGIPGAVLTSQSACVYLTKARGASLADDIQARAALYNLARLGLLTIDTTSAARTVRVHPLVQATVRGNLTPAALEVAARAAADALMQCWPRRSMPASFEQALRDCTAAVHGLSGRLLWAPDWHPLLVRAGLSLDSAGLAGPAVSYWQLMGGTSEQEFGPDHANTVLARDRLAAAYESAGRVNDAIGAYEQALSQREQALGAGHPDALSTRAHLARAYRAAGRAADAARLAERILTEYEQALGPAHPETLTARSDLAHAYLAAGRFPEAVAAFQHTLAGREQVLGPGHPDTLTARASLAYAFRAAGQLRNAIAIYEQTLAEREHAQGADHPDTMTARASLAAAYRSAGRLKDAAAVCKRTLADRERVQGPDHPDTVSARASLADTLHLANKFKDAIPLYERTLADRQRVQGPDHPDTITARGNLASAYHSARKLTQAVPLYERTLADCERVLGPAHPDTLTSRGNLAHAYHTLGRHSEALALFQRTLAECEQALGADHPLTKTARENLQAAVGG